MHGLLTEKCSQHTHHHFAVFVHLLCHWSTAFPGTCKHEKSGSLSLVTNAVQVFSVLFFQGTLEQFFFVPCKQLVSMCESICYNLSH